MDDYRDIGASDFERYEKIRARISSIVEDFDLITNSTPSTLQIDPVLVVYDLASADTVVNLPPETQRFKRAVVEQTETVSPGGSTDLIFPSVNGEIPFTALNGRVERLTALYVRIDGSALGAGSARVQATVNDGLGASPNGLPVLLLGISPGNDNLWTVSANDNVFVATTEDPVPGAGFLLSNLVVGSTQNLTFTCESKPASDADVDFDIRFQYEYFNT